MEADKSFWAERWQTGRTGWDLGGPHPLLRGLLKEAQGEQLPVGGRILEPGCGRAHGGAWLAGEGYEVVAFDLVEEALTAARELYATVPRLSFEVRDALTPVPEWKESFDAVYDRAMLCALPATLRRAYIEACFSHLKPGGLLMTVPFTSCTTGPAEGPPFQIAMRDLSELLAPLFSLLHAEERPVVGQTLDAKVRVETACLWRRRTRNLVEAR